MDEQDPSQQDNEIEALINANKDNVRRLVAQLSDSSTGVIPFVGAGLSATFGFPMWAAFLRHVAKEAGIENRVKILLKNFDFEQAAEEVMDALGSFRFNDEVENQYGGHRIESFTLIGAITLLPRLARGPVITTNFDRVVEMAFEQAAQPFKERLWGAHPDAAAQALNQNERFLLKIHGDVLDRSDRVFTRQDYKRVYGDVDGKDVDMELPLPRLLHQILLNRPLLFLGCSLQQDRTMSVLERVASQFTASGHFAIVEEPVLKRERVKRAKFLSERHIRPIWFPHERYDMIEPLLLQILKRLTPKSPASTTFNPTGVTAEHVNELLKSLNIQEATTTSIVVGGQPLLVVDRRQTIRQNFDDASLPHSGPETALHARIDVAKNLLNEGQLTAAQNVLTSLRQDPAVEKGSDELKFRIAANLGGVAIRQDRIEDAIREFQKAYAYQPDNAKANTMMALAALIDGRTERCLSYCRTSLALNPRDADAMALYIDALGRSGQIDDIAKLKETELWILDDATCLSALGQVQFDRGDYSDAELLYRGAVERDPKNAQNWMQLGLSIWATYRDRFRLAMPLPASMDTETSKRLNEASDAFGRTIELLKDSDYYALLASAYLNRASIRQVQGNTDAAVSDLTSRPVAAYQDAGFIKMKGLIWLSMGRYAEAVAAFERIGADSNDHEAIIPPLASAYLQNHQPQTAIELLSPLWKAEGDVYKVPFVADVLMAAYREVRNEHAIQGILSDIGNNWDSLAEGLMVLAHQARREANLVQAERLLRKAIELGTFHPDHLAVELGELLYDQERYAEAATQLEPYVDTTTNSMPLQEYLISLYNTGTPEAHKKAQDIATKIRNGGEPIPIISDIEANILEGIGALDEARDLRRHLVRIDYTNVEHRIRYAILSLRLDDKASARAAIEQIQLNDIIKQPTALMQVAHVRATLKMREVLRYAYAARRMGYDDPRIHSEYVQLCISQTEAEIPSPQPERVEIDCVVNLRQDGVPFRRLVVSEAFDGKRPDELLEDDPVAQQLLGKAIGDTVQLRETEFESVVVEIVSVLNKYVAACQESMEQFAVLFPGDRTIQKIDIRDADTLRKLVLRPEPEEVKRLYREGQAPLVLLAETTGRPLLNVWSDYAVTDGEVLIVSSGNQAEIESECESIRRTTEITLELTSLLALFAFGLEDYASAHFQRIYAPQAVIDEIDGRIWRNDIEGKPHSTIDTNQDQLCYHEYTDEELANRRSLLERMSRFLKEKCTSAPVSRLLELTTEQREQLTRILGGSTLASILVAKETNSVLFTEDRYLRGLASHSEEFGVIGAWTFALLRNLRAEKAITEEEYSRKVINMIAANYRLVPIERLDLLQLARDEGWVITPRFKMVLRTLEHPDINMETLIYLLATFVFDVWQQRTLLDRKEAILENVLDALCAGRDARKILPTFQKVMSALFRQYIIFIPGEQHIQQRMESWRRRHA